ncbi:MAG: hypothetical protein VXV96_10850 [Bdellovibrionota bacterium]|nr:hypothetical protein [Bdellovibrionota bacterium]
MLASKIFRPSSLHYYGLFVFLGSQVCLLVLLSLCFYRTEELEGAKSEFLALLIIFVLSSIFSYWVCFSFSSKTLAITENSVHLYQKTIYFKDRLLTSFNKSEVSKVELSNNKLVIYLSSGDEILLNSNFTTHKGILSTDKDLGEGILEKIKETIES